MPQYVVGRQGLYLYTVQHLTLWPSRNYDIRRKQLPAPDADFEDVAAWGRPSGSPRFTSWRGARGSTHLISSHATGWSSIVALSDSGELTSSSWIFRGRWCVAFFSTRLTPSVTEMMRGTIGPAGMMRDRAGGADRPAIHAKFDRQQAGSDAVGKPRVHLLNAIGIWPDRRRSDRQARLRPGLRDCSGRILRADFDPDRNGRVAPALWDATGS